MGEDGSRPTGCDRRTVVVSGAAAALSLIASPRGAAAAASNERPAKGDTLVVDDSGPNKGKPVTLDMLQPGGRFITAWPVDAASGTVRTGSRFNKLVVIRLAGDKITDAVRPQAAEGVIAYSIICTHQNCPVSAWKPEDQTVACVCHGSEFSVVDAGAVFKGPATKRLPMLPLAVGDDGILRVAGEFTAKPGPG